MDHSDHVERGQVLEGGLALWQINMAHVAMADKYGLSYTTTNLSNPLFSVLSGKRMLLVDNIQMSASPGFTSAPHWLPYLVSLHPIKTKPGEKGRIIAALGQKNLAGWLCSRYPHRVGWDFLDLHSNLPFSSDQSYYFLSGTYSCWSSCHAVSQLLLEEKTTYDSHQLDLTGAIIETLLWFLWDSS